MSDLNRPQVVLCPSEDIQSVSRLLSAFEQALEMEARHIQVDPSAVERVTTPALQLLLAAKKEAAARDRILTFTAPAKPTRPAALKRLARQAPARLR